MSNFVQLNDLMKKVLTVQPKTYNVNMQSGKDISESIFKDIDANHDGKLSHEEVNIKNQQELMNYNLYQSRKEEKKEIKKSKPSFV